MPGALLVQVDGDAAGARAGKVRPKPDLLEIGRAKLLEAPPLEPLQELRRALGVVELRAPGVRAEEAPGDAAERGAGGGGGFRGEGERMRERASVPRAIESSRFLGGIADTNPGTKREGA